MIKAKVMAIVCLVVAIVFLISAVLNLIMILVFPNSGTTAITIIIFSTILSIVNFHLYRGYKEKAEKNG